MESHFVATLADISQIPDFFRGPYLKGLNQPRLVFVGRSNVGKSSLINALIGTRFAQTSRKPGKTRAIHFYFWKEANKIIADLPGYGYAQAAKAERERWKTFIQKYFQLDQSLERAVVLLDARHGPTSIDLEAIQFLSLSDIPVTFVFAKADTLRTQAERDLRKKQVNQAIQDLGFESESAFWVSSKTGAGLDLLARDLGVVNPRGRK